MQGCNQGAGGSSFISSLRSAASLYTSARHVTATALSSASDRETFLVSLNVYCAYHPVQPPGT